MGWTWSCLLFCFISGSKLFSRLFVCFNLDSFATHLFKSSYLFSNFLFSACLDFLKRAHSVMQQLYVLTLTNNRLNSFSAYFLKGQVNFYIFYPPSFRELLTEENEISINLCILIDWYVCYLDNYLWNFVFLPNICGLCFSLF